MKNVEQLLKEAGSDLSHIVKTTTYLIDPAIASRSIRRWANG